MDKTRTYIIAEAGVNHNGSLDTALRLVDIAREAGADAVKFQTFKASSLVTATAQKAQYQRLATAADETQLDMLRRLELSHADHRTLYDYCAKRNIEFLSTAFDEESLDFLVTKLGLTRLKIASGEITNAPSLLAHACSGRDLIVSTGMASLDEVESALSVIAFGLTACGDEQPGQQAFAKAFVSDAGQVALRERVTLLHCTTEYPAPAADINLSAIETMRNAFNLPVGYSDHSDGIAIAIAAVACGASVIEKHFTLDKTSTGPDHKASLEPAELRSMIESIRIVEQAIGDGVKQPKPSEVKNMEVARKSLTAAMDITRGEPFSAQNLAVLRPGSGISPMEYWDMLGKKATVDYKKGDLIHG